MRGYDAWLERPYQDACEAADRFLDWCETHNMDPDDPDAETFYNDYIDSLWEEPDNYNDEREEDDY